MIWLVVIACWALSFLFAGIEAGLLALDPVRVRHRAKNGERAAVRLERLLQHPERLLVTVLLATNAADLAALLIVTREFVYLFGPMGYLWTILLSLPVYLFLLNVLPKSLFRRFPFRALAHLAGLIEMTTKIFWPLLALGESVVRRFFAAGAEAPRLFAAREDLKLITMQSERGGALSATERAMIHNVVDFTAVRVRDVMIPLAKTVTITPQLSPADVLQLSDRHGIDRLPVVSEERRAIGLVNVFDLLFDPQPSLNLSNYTRRIINASASESAYRVVRRLRAARIGLAAVTDKRQELIGIVVLEDLVRQLVSA